MTVRLPRPRILERGFGGSTVAMSVLPGGLRVATESMPGAQSACVGLWVGVGSIDEAPGLAGVSHFLEHVLFKGTRRRSASEIAAEIDAFGGELNAFTSHEYTCYYAHTLAEHAATAIDVVCDVVLGARIASRDVEVERTVIADEIAMRDDDPEDALADALAGRVFSGHPVASPVAGTYRSIESLTRRQIHGYYRRRYVPSAMVVAVAGGVEHREVVRWVRDAFGDCLTTTRTPAAPRMGPAFVAAGPGIALTRRDGEQAHLGVGVAAPSRHDPARYALAVLSTALGGGMSSRLFQRVREERGLAYSCYTATSSYASTGSFAIYAGCQPDNLGTVADLVAAELADVTAHGLSADEVARAQQQICGSMVLALETSDARMSRLGKSLLVRGDHLPIDKELAAIRAVTPADVADLARRLLTGPMAAAVVGPYAHRTRLPAPVRALARASRRRRPA